MSKELRELYGNTPARRGNWNLHAPRHGLSEDDFHLEFFFLNAAGEVGAIVRAVAWDDRRTKYKVVLLNLADRKILVCSVSQMKAQLKKYQTRPLPKSN